MATGAEPTFGDFLRTFRDRPPLPADASPYDGGSCRLSMIAFRPF